MAHDCGWSTFHSRPIALTSWPARSFKQPPRRTDPSSRSIHADRGDQTSTAGLKDEYVFGYDNLDRLTTVADTASTAANTSLTSMPTGTPIVNWTRTYANNGDLASLAASVNSTPNFVNSYAYDNLGRMTQVAQSGSGIAGKQVDLTYNAAGQFASIVRSSGSEVARTSYSYFDGGGLKEIANTHAGAALSSYSWTYDALDRVASLTAPEGTFDYTYDVTDQLVDSAFTAGGGFTVAPRANRFRGTRPATRTIRVPRSARGTNSRPMRRTATATMTKGA